MNSLWSIGLPILVVDVANPVLLAAVILALTTPRPLALSISVIAGHTLAYFGAGVLIAFGLADLIGQMLSPLLDRFSNPIPVDFVIGLAIGILLLVVAWRWKVAPPDPAKKGADEPKQSIGMALAFGGIINFAGIPFALPYFAFINELYQLDGESKLSALVVYNLLYAVPFLLLPLAFAIMGKSVMSVFERINEIVAKYSAYIIPAIIGLLGAALVLDALLYFWSGTGLY
ncbi:GAP family protein [Aliiruegeria haliotis]|nr:GAP family protein [Aliiruegeria haliotis]